MMHAQPAARLRIEEGCPREVERNRPRRARSRSRAEPADETSCAEREDDVNVRAGRLDQPRFKLDDGSLRRADRCKIADVLRMDAEKDFASHLTGRTSVRPGNGEVDFDAIRAKDGRSGYCAKDHGEEDGRDRRCPGICVVRAQADAIGADTSVAPGRGLDSDDANEPRGHTRWTTAAALAAVVLTSHTLR